MRKIWVVIVRSQAEIIEREEDVFFLDSAHETKEAALERGKKFPYARIESVWYSEAVLCKLLEDFVASAEAVLECCDSELGIDTFQFQGFHELKNCLKRYEEV